jgi:ATP-dependent Clp protease ATP-binding subunit ClpA
MILDRRRHRRGKLAEAYELAPVVSELFAAAEEEATAFRHDSIGTEHVLLALIGGHDATGRALRGLGLELAGVRVEIHRIVDDRPGQGVAFDEDALGAIGIDLKVVRQRVEEMFGHGALERALRRQGSCRAAAFGVDPRLKQALERARLAARERSVPVGAADVALSLAEQTDSVAGRILEAHAISPERLGAALRDDLDAHA